MAPVRGKSDTRRHRGSLCSPPSGPRPLAGQGPPGQGPWVRLGTTLVLPPGSPCPMLTPSGDNCPGQEEAAAIRGQSPHGVEVSSTVLAPLVWGEARPLFSQVFPVPCEQRDTWLEVPSVAHHLQGFSTWRPPGLPAPGGAVQLQLLLHRPGRGQRAGTFLHVASMLGLQAPERSSGQCKHMGRCALEEVRSPQAQWEGGGQQPVSCFGKFLPQLLPSFGLEIHSPDGEESLEKPVKDLG